jgi:hypothetical protein
MKRVDKVFVNVIATITIILVVLIVFYFTTESNAFDGTWKHTYFLGSILFFCVIGLAGFFIQKITGKKEEKMTPKRSRDDYGKHPNDFEHKCCFKEQIIKIGEGTKDGSGEELTIKMESGKIAIFQLFSERYNYTGDYTGQRNWRYHFVKYL